MATEHISVSRFHVTSSKTFDAVLSDFHAAVRKPYINSLSLSMDETTNYSDFENLINAVVGSSGFMEFIRFNLGSVLSKKNGATAPQSIRLVLGNPVLMAQMVELVPDAASYAPVTILVDERSDGTHVSYDEMSSFLAPYKSEKASLMARDLDTRIESLITSVAT